MKAEILSDEQISRTFTDCHAIYDGHVVFTKKEIPAGSGKWAYFHGDRYVDKCELIWLPTNLNKLARETARRLVGKKIDVIVGPEKGAISLATLVAIHLTEMQDSALLPAWGEVAACFSEKVGTEKMEIKRVFAEHIRNNPGCNVWICEDIGNSGSSARKTVIAARELGANVVGVSFLGVRRLITSDDMDGVPVEWLIMIKGLMWPEDECALCKRDGVGSVSLTVGKGEDFLKRKEVSK